MNFKLPYFISFFLIGSLLVAIGCNTSTYSQGKRIYQSLCENCHGEDCQGLEKLIPALTPAHFSNENLDNTVCIIINGINADKLGEDMNVMPANKKISQVELTNLINYIRNDLFKMNTELNLILIDKATTNCK